MFRIVDYQATEPVHKVNQKNPSPIAHSPKKTVLADICITIPGRDANRNHVELIATVGVRGVSVLHKFYLKFFVMDKKSLGLKKE